MSIFLDVYDMYNDLVCVYAFYIKSECVYVGSTRNFKARCLVHKMKYDYDNGLLYKKIKDDGYTFKDIQIKILEQYPSYDKDLLHQAESEFIKLLCPKYNTKNSYIPKYICNACDRSFRHNYDLVIHIRSCKNVERNGKMFEEFLSQ